MQIYGPFIAIFLAVLTVSELTQAQVLACSLRASTITRHLILPEDPCSPLKVGQTRIVSRGNPVGPPSPTLHPMNYAITGIEGAYLLEFNPNLVSTKNKDLEKLGLVRIQNCFKEFNTTSGNIKLGLNSNPKIPSITINITDQKIRENKNNISTKSLCKVIVHEFLHHAGLGDEYPEDLATRKGDQSCRLPSPARDSIMSEGTLKGVNPVLYPAHRRSLIFPGCKKKNDLYSACIRSSRQVAIANSSCYVDKRCKEGTWLR